MKWDSLIFMALNYLIRNYDEMTHYFDIPEMPIDNTDTERFIRDIVIGRRLICSVETWMLVSGQL